MAKVSMLLLATAIVYALIGLSLIIGGAWLLWLGGSVYYCIAGVAIVVTAGLLVARRAAALWLFAAVLLGTLVWALLEIGLDWWPLAARGDVVFPMGLWLLTPWVVCGLDVGQRWVPSTRLAAVLPLWLAIAASTVVLVVAPLRDPHDISGTIKASTTAIVPPSETQPADDWRAYGRTQLGLRYSPLTQITPETVKTLKVAWQFETGDRQESNDPVETTFEVTPIKVGGNLYLCSQHQRLFALDAASGKLLWSYDPHVQDNPTFQHLTCRGVTYHETMRGAENANATPTPAECLRTIFLPVNDGRMIALNADTGKLCTDFGAAGTLDLQLGMGVQTSGFYETTSPPVESDKILVVAGAVIDNYSTAEPSGVIRGFDIHSGKLIWAWDSGNIDENMLTSPGHPYTNNSPNSWIASAYDPKLGLIYVPMGVHTPDIWGGDRLPVMERYSSALVALDINTGKRVWSYQTVHHDLWDMDLPAQPSLVDITTDKGVVPAVLQPAKTGDLFVLDRRTGELIVPAPERPAPQGAAPGDRVSPTQPASELTFRPETKLTGSDMWGATIFDQLACRIMFHQLRYEGTFTPPSEQGTLVFPGNLGMFEWGGIAVDPVRQIAIANPIAIPFISKLIPRGANNPVAPNAAHPPGSEIGVQPMYGSPYGVILRPFLSPIGIPCLRPPWGFMAGIDLTTRKIAWMHRNGTIRDSAPLPIPLKLGVPSLGGPLTTAGGVAFLTSTSDYFIRAYDVTSGQQLWEDRLPAGGQSTPMSYAVGGKQYVVTAAGGHGSFGTKRGDYVIAYAMQ